VELGKAGAETDKGKDVFCGSRCYRRSSGHRLRDNVSCRYFYFL